MPWRKRYDPTLSIEEKGQRAYEIWGESRLHSRYAGRGGQREWHSGLDWADAFLPLHRRSTLPSLLTQTSPLSRLNATSAADLTLDYLVLTVLAVLDSLAVQSPK